MICTIIADISRVDYDEAKRNVERVFYFKYIIDEKKPNAKRASIGAYLTLYHAYKMHFGKRMPTVKKWKNSKPRFKKPWEREVVGFLPPNPKDKTPEVDFNISHSGDLALISMMWDEEEGLSVGVDIQKTVLKRTEENVMGSLLTDIDFSQYKPLDDIEHKIYYCSLEKNGDLMYFDNIDILRGEPGAETKSMKFINKKLQIENSYLHYAPHCRSVAQDFYVAWTVTEAVLKATGRGFAAFRGIGEHLRGSRCVSASLTVRGVEYYITVCVGHRLEDNEEIIYWDLPLDGYSPPNPRGPNGEFYPPTPLFDIDDENAFRLLGYELLEEGEDCIDGWDTAMFLQPGHAPDHNK